MKFADFNKKVISESVDYSVNKITEIIKKIGPRESGSKQCFDAQQMLRKDLEQYADEVHYEEYKMAPKAFLHFTKTVSDGVIAAVAAGAALKFAKPEKLAKLGKLAKSPVTPHALVAVATGGGLFVTAMEFLFYKQFCDGLYKKTTGRNLIATRKSTGETKKKIIVSGHIDSAYEWRHIYYGKGKLMAPLMGGTIASAAVTTVLGITSSVLAANNATGKLAKFLMDKGYYFHFFTILNMLTLHAFVNFKVLAPGANDNLTGTLAAVSALKMLDEAGIRFDDTEVECIITDGEEAGLRGCKQLAKDHYKDYVESGIKTSILCVDTLTDLDYLNVYNRDMTGLVKHDPEFCKLVMDAAHEAGHDGLKYASVFFGSSDAAAFSQAGISATCLAAMDPGPAEYYHNRRDTYDKLNPEAIKTGYDVIMSTILNFADED